MLRPLIVGTLALVSALGLAGTASAACDDTALLGQSTTYCALEYQGDCCGTWYAHTLASMMSQGRAGSYGLAAYQYGYADPSFPTTRGTGVSLFGSAQGEHFGLSLYQYDVDADEGTYQGTGFYLGAAGFFFRGGQFTFNEECDVVVADSEGVVALLPCDGAPQVPSVPVLPNL